MEKKFVVKFACIDHINAFQVRLCRLNENCDLRYFICYNFEII